MGILKPIDIVFAISFLDLFSVGLIFPVFQQHLRDLGISRTSVGFITSSYSAIQVLSGPVIGSWSDIRDRKSVLKYTLFLCSICYGLLGITNSIGFILLLRLLLGIFKHTQSICKAVITDVLPLKEQSEVFAKSASVGSLGFILGPFVAGHLAELPNGFSYVSLATAVSFMATYVFACYLPEEIKSKNSKNSSIITNISRWNTIKSEIKNSVTEIKEVDWSQHWDTFLLKFLLGFTMSCYWSNQGLYLRETYNLSQKHIGYTISFFSSVGIVAGLFLRKINSVLNSDIYMKMCFWYTVLGFSFIGLSLSSHFVTCLIALVPLSIASTAMRVTTMELMFKKSKALHKGSLSGASNSTMSVARFVTPLFAGITSDIFNEHSAMLIAVFPASLGFFLSFYIKKREDKKVK